MGRTNGPSNFRLYLLLGGIYLVLLGTLMAVSVALDVRRAEQRFFDNARFIQSHFEVLAQRNLNALHGFAALLEIEDMSERDKIANYARSVLATQTNIYMLEVVEKLDAAQVARIGGEFSRKGIDGFRPKYGHQGRMLPVPDKPVYYLLTFMEPMLPEAQEVLGMDFESTSYLKDALERALATRQAVVSRPFRLVEGDVAYTLLRVVERNGQLRVAVVVCKVADLLPAETNRLGDLTVEIAYGGDDAGTEENWSLRRTAANGRGPWASLFPALEATYPSDGPEQPFKLRIEQSLDSGIVQFSMLATISLVGLMALLALVGFARAHHRHEMKRLEESEKLFYMANFDPLTGLANRQLFINRLEQALAMAHRHGGRHAVLFLDLDGFKGVNDYYGHQTGDRVLQRAARIFQRCVREIDTVSRFGGDEFVILLQNVEGRIKAQRVAAKIKKIFARQEAESSRLLPAIGTSIGIALYPDDGRTASELIHQADQDMYVDKAERKASRGSASNHEIAFV